MPHLPAQADPNPVGNAAIRRGLKLRDVCMTTFDEMPQHVQNGRVRVSTASGIQLATCQIPSSMSKRQSTSFNLDYGAFMYPRY